MVVAGHNVELLETRAHYAVSTGVASIRMAQ